MKTASRILGTAFFLEGFEVQDAPRYGAERRGAPLFAYVRAARAPIHERGVIDRPDLVVVADDSLPGVPAAGVMAGVDRHTTLLIISHELPAQWRERLNLSGSLFVLPAPPDVRDRSNLPHAGTTCAGAAARLVGAISRDNLLHAVDMEVGALGDDVAAQNRSAAAAAYDAMSAHAGSVREGAAISATAFERPEWITLPFDGADASAPTIHAALTSVEVHTGLWRTLRPVIQPQHCNRCWWICSTLCPDSAIRVTADGAPDIDYDHCKGCLVCVAVCPHHAIDTIPEHQAAA